MNLSFTSDEVEFLLAILQERQRELLREISRASHHEFKISLRNHEQLLESVVSKLKDAYPSEHIARSA